jgi:DNA polymerase
LADIGGVESLLSFWADAGIDLCLEAEPVNRMTETAQMMRAPAPPPPLRVAPTAKGPAAVNSAALEAAAEKAKGLAASASKATRLATPSSTRAPSVAAPRGLAPGVTR